MRWFRFALQLVVAFYLFDVNYLRYSEIGIARNFFTGQIWLQDHGGFYLTAPWVMVSRIDTRPMRVSITTRGRGFNSRLVQFNKAAWRDFVMTEGFRYYWWSNRLSFNYGYKEEYRGMRDLMRGYAFGVKRYPFIILQEEVHENES